MTMPVHISPAAFWSWPLSFLPMTKQDAVNGSNIASSKLEGVGVTPIFNNKRKNESKGQLQNPTASWPAVLYGARQFLLL